MNANDPVTLREVQPEDLPFFFEHQADPQAAFMAAFPSREREAFLVHWTRLLRDERLSKQTILFNGQVAGNLVCFEMEGHQEVGYWLGRDFWGRGIATRALQLFLPLIQIRPLYGYVVADNLGSQRVLQKCGFKPAGSITEFSAERGMDVEFLIFKLE